MSRKTDTKTSSCTEYTEFLGKVEEKKFLYRIVKKHAQKIEKEQNLNKMVFLILELIQKHYGQSGSESSHGK